LLLATINLLLIGVAEDPAGYFTACPYVQQSVYCLLYCTVLSNTIELKTVNVKGKAEGEAFIA
jgi:hypothetical protein